MNLTPSSGLNKSKKLFKSKDLRFLPQSSKKIGNRPQASRASSDALFCEEGSLDVAYRSHRKLKLLLLSFILGVHIIAINYFPVVLLLFPPKA